MTEQEFRQALQRSLSGADLPEHRKRQVLAQMKGVNAMKKHTKFRIVFALLALLLLTTATAAVATSVFHGTVDWNGQPKDDQVISMLATQAASSSQPAVTSVPTQSGDPLSDNPPTPEVIQQPVNTIARLTEITTLLHDQQQQANGDLIIIHEQDDNPHNSLVSRRTTSQRYLRTSSYEELQALLADTPLPLPHALPEGYHITLTRVNLDCRIDGEYTPVAAEDRTLTADGSTVTVSRYRASAEHDFISGYLIGLETDVGDRLVIMASMTSFTGQDGFGLWDDETAQAVEVPGMQNALLIQGSTRTQLSMRQPLPQPISVIDIMHPDIEDPNRSETLDDLFIHIEATSLDGDALLALFR